MFQAITGSLLILVVGFIPFAFMHLLPFGAIFLALWGLIGRERAFVSACLGTIFVWASVFLTERIYKAFGNFTAPDVYGISGAPLIAFLYPVPPMGSDYASGQMWLRFFFNYVFWIAIAIGVSKPISSFVFRKTRYGRPLVYVLGLSAFGFMAAGFVHILIAFD